MDDECVALEDDEPARVERNRYERLRDLGFRPSPATELARSRDVDVHYVEQQLIRRGCDPDTAVRIVL